jgi:putative AdoMet-dependent methyltransferase
MTTSARWQWDETVAINLDFGDRAVVAAYDERHRRFRDVDGENEAILARLDLKPSQIVADFGCGTGAFARLAARQCGMTYAIDLSAAMLDYVGWKAQEAGLANLVCRQGGFLTYAHDGPPFDAVHTSLALHHLPDFWKQQALARLAGMLKPGGKLHLMDVVFQEDNCAANIEAWIAAMTTKGGAEVGESIRAHVAKEYSTFTWILEGLLARADFRIDHAEHSGGVLAHYYCTKV